MHQSHLPLPISSLNGGRGGCQQHAHPLPVRTHQAVGERSQVQSARQHGPSTAPEWTPPLEQAVSGLPQVEGVEGSASHGLWIGHTVHMANGGQHVQGVQVGVCPLCVPWEWHWRGSGPGTGALRLDQKRAFILQCITPQNSHPNQGPATCKTCVPHAAWIWVWECLHGRCPHPSSQTPGIRTPDGIPCNHYVPKEKQHLSPDIPTWAPSATLQEPTPNLLHPPGPVCLSWRLVIQAGR